jgi:hypothetical protein
MTVIKIWGVTVVRSHVPTNVPYFHLQKLPLQLHRFASQPVLTVADEDLNLEVFGKSLA